MAMKMLETMIKEVTITTSTISTTVPGMRDGIALSASHLKRRQRRQRNLRRLPYRLRLHPHRPI